MGQTKAQPVATLQAGIDADEAKATKESALKGAQQDLRDAVAALDTASDSLLILLRAFHRKGSPERPVLDQSLGSHHTTQKKEVEQPEEKPA